MRAVLDIVLLALQLYIYVIVAAAILSWLIAFNVVNIRNNLVHSFWTMLTNLTEPALRPIRRFLPNLGAVDISPVILLLLILLVQDIIQRYLYPYVF